METLDTNAAEILVDQLFTLGEHKAACDLIDTICKYIPDFMADAAV